MPLSPPPPLPSEARALEQVRAFAEPRRQQAATAAAAVARPVQLRNLHVRDGLFCVRAASGRTRGDTDDHTETAVANDADDDRPAEKFIDVVGGFLLQVSESLPPRPRPHTCRSPLHCRGDGHGLSVADYDISGLRQR